MLKRLAPFAALAALWLGMASADELPFKEGPVLDVSPVKVQDGKFFEYWNWLATHWRPTMEAAKKQGLVLSYAVYAATPRNPQEPDLYLVVTYPNYAVFDGLDAKMNAIEQQLFGTTPQKAEAASGERRNLRQVFGDEIMRELQFTK